MTSRTVASLETSLATALICCTTTSCVMVVESLRPNSEPGVNRLAQYPNAIRISSATIASAAPTPKKRLGMGRIVTVLSSGSVIRPRCSHVGDDERLIYVIFVLVAIFPALYVSRTLSRQTQLSRKYMRSLVSRWSVAIALTFSAPFVITAQTGKVAPLLDRELFFGNPEISGAQISPDGRYVSFLKPYKDTRNVWVKRASDPYSAAKLITNDTKRPVTQYFWSRDGKYILFVQDQGGDENFNVYAVDPASSPAAGQEVPTARNLTAAKGVRAIIYDVPKNDPDIMYVGINDRDKAWHDLYKVRISTGEKTLLRQNTERIAGWEFDNAGNLRLAVRTTDKGDTEILRVDPTGFTQVYSCNVFETCNPLRYDKSNTKVYMETNKGAPDLTRLVLFDPATKQETLVESDPLNRVDFGNASFSDVTNELVATAYVDDRARIYWKNPDWEKDYNIRKSKLPDEELNVGSTTNDERLWMIIANSDREPGERYLFDRSTKKLTFQYRVFDKLPREALAQVKPI